MYPKGEDWTMCLAANAVDKKWQQFFPQYCYSAKVWILVVERKPQTGEFGLYSTTE